MTQPSASYVYLIRPDIPDEWDIRTDELFTILWDAGAGKVGLATVFWTTHV